MSRSRLEMETIINFNAEEEMASLYTASPSVYKKMIKRGFKPESLGKESWTFEIPKNSVKLPRLPRKLQGKSRESAIKCAELARKAKSSIK